MVRQKNGLRKWKEKYLGAEALAASKEIGLETPLPQDFVEKHVNHMFTGSASDRLSKI